MIFRKKWLTCIFNKELTRKRNSVFSWDRRERILPRSCKCIDMQVSIFLPIYIWRFFSKNMASLSLHCQACKDGREKMEYPTSYVHISGSSPIWFKRDEDMCNQRAEETAYSCFEGTVYLGYLYTIGVCWIYYKGEHAHIYIYVHTCT